MRAKKRDSENGQDRVDIFQGYSAHYIFKLSSFSVLQASLYVRSILLVGMRLSQEQIIRRRNLMHHHQQLVIPETTPKPSKRLLKTFRNSFQFICCNRKTVITKIAPTKMGSSNPISREVVLESTSKSIFHEKSKSNMNYVCEYVVVVIKCKLKNSFSFR